LPSGRRSGPVGAEGSLIREVRERAGAALTKPGRVSTARWGGSGEQDREEHARNRCLKAPQRFTDSNLADVGRERRVRRHEVPRELPGSGEARSRGGCGEDLRRNRSDAAGAESGSSSIERITVNTGTVAGPPCRALPVLWSGLGSSSADRLAAGRSCRSTPRSGKPITWGRATAGGDSWLL
jgi:hypothetical protein